MKNLLALMVCALMTGFSSCNSSTNNDTTESCASQKQNMVYVMNLERKVKPEHIEAFKASFEQCKVGTLQEPGCLDYGMYQSYTDSTRFFIHETWKTKGAHLVHTETPHLKAHVANVKDMYDPTFKPNNVEIYVCPAVNE